MGLRSFLKSLVDRVLPSSTRQRNDKVIEYSDMDPIPPASSPESFMVQDSHLVGATATFSNGRVTPTTLDFLPKGYLFLIVLC